MIIQTPQVREAVAPLSWVGDVYQINGEELDFSQLLDGEILPIEAVNNALIISDVKRVGTELFFAYIHPYEEEGSTHDDKYPPTLDNTKDSI